MTSLADEVIENIELIRQPDRAPEMIIEVDGVEVGRVVGGLRPGDRTAGPVHVMQEVTLNGVLQRRYIGGPPPEEAVQMDVEAMLTLVRASVDWAQDTGDCHFCGDYRESGRHDEDCPVLPFDQPQAPGEWPEDDRFRDPNVFPIATSHTISFEPNDDVSIENVEVHIIPPFDGVDLDAIPGVEGSNAAPSPEDRRSR